MKFLAWAIYTPRRALAVLATVAALVLFAGYTANYFREVRDYNQAQERAVAVAEREASGEGNETVVRAPDARDFNFDVPGDVTPTALARPDADTDLEAVEDDTVVIGPEEAGQALAQRAAATAFTSAWLAGRTAPDRPAWEAAVAAHAVPAVAASITATPASAIPAAQLVKTTVTTMAAADETAQVLVDLSAGDDLTLDLVYDGSSWKVSYYGPAST